ncbi:hypothetical protein BVX98_01610 [bacterium F11]|nr:hypothetical protein BVX98_01610 [bacterium F11]
MTTKILIVDDHKIVRQGLRSMLTKESDFEVVGECRNGLEAVKMSSRLQAEVIIMDISMPYLNGIEATQQIIKRNPKTRVLAMSMHENKKIIGRILKSGASGYILKNCDFSELTKAIRTLIKDKIYIDPSVINNVIEDYKDLLMIQDTSTLTTLSSREKEVFQLLTEGKSIKMIAHILLISPKTAETHRKNLMDKLGVDNLADLIKLGLKEELTPLEV